MDSAPKPLTMRRLAPDESPVPEHHEMLAYWRELKGERMAPTWAEFDLSMIDPKVLPWTAVVDISADRKDIRYRFWGTQLTVVRGEDFTNRPVSEIPPVELGEFIHASYVATAESKEPGLDIEQYVAQSGRTGSKAVLRLPLSDDGETVNKVVACMIYDISRNGEEVVEFLESIHAPVRSG
ncbi:MAG: PAS domain-containing protein [Rhodospirillales bacterium]|nr:PAS domain-containing protein [Rhodospirillales bacterium]MBO6788323.1 PAS domain-containing protein [Rhodospirillales bacterium]